MASKTETIWTEEQHSNAKRVILRKYLEAYIPVIGSSNKTLNIIDFFAGPGKYFGQEDKENGGNEMNTKAKQKPDMTVPPREMGSPMIALHAAIEYFEEQIRRRRGKERSLHSEMVTRIRLFFGEAREDRLLTLKERVRAALTLRGSEWKIPSEGKDKLVTCNGKLEIEITFVGGKFKNFPVEIVSENEPTFAFIDPFGYEAIPFTLIQQLCRKRRMEVFINLMVQPMQRGIGKATQLDSFTESITTALGTDEWKMTAREEKITGDELAQIYAKQLKEKAGMTFTLDFTMRNKKNVRLYHLIFATKHIMGVRCMKEAMNRVTQDEAGLSFSSFLVQKCNKEVSWSNKQDNAEAARTIYQKFKGKKVYVRTSKEHFPCDEMSVEGFILLQTPFVFRSEQLRSMFKDGKIKLNHSLVSDRNRYPENPSDEIPCEVTFMKDRERFGHKEFVEMMNSELEEKILVEEGRYGYQYNDVQRLFKHSVLSVDDGGNEVKADKYLKSLKSLAPHPFICYKKDDGGGYKVFERKGHSHKNQECIMWFDNQMATVDQEERPAI